MNNITLIGMPGAGKSTTGIILAKNMALGYLDTDVLIQINSAKPLQDIIDEHGHLYMRDIEESEILKINIDNTVIATGGSVAYSEPAMKHLREISTVVFLEVSFDELKRRITNFETRGIAKRDDQTFEDLFEERRALYEQYKHVKVVAEGKTQEQVALDIEKAVKEFCK